MIFIIILNFGKIIYIIQKQVVLKKIMIQMMHIDGIMILWINKKNQKEENEKAENNEINPENKNDKIDILFYEKIK
jgi:hypothetical protein